MTEQHIAWAQITLAVLFIGGYFAILFAFMAGYVKVPADYREAFMALLGVLTAGVVGILNYFFQRQRAQTGG